jgi:hypothetical protein
MGGCELALRTHTEVAADPSVRAARLADADIGTGQLDRRGARQVHRLGERAVDDAV